MRASGLGLRAFSRDVLGVDHAIISRLLNGKQASLSRPNIRKVAAGLGMQPAEVDDLLPELDTAGSASAAPADVASRLARLDPRIRVWFYGMLQEMETLSPEEAAPVLDDIERYAAEQLRGLGERRGPGRATRRRAS